MLTDTLDADNKRIPLRFTVPHELHEISLDEPAEDRIRRTYQSLSAAVRGFTERQLLHHVYSQEKMLAELWEEGAVYVGLCCGRSEADPSTLSTAQFTILVKKADLDARQPLHAVAGGLRKPGEPREVLHAEYPAGEAVVVGEELSVTVPYGPLGEPIRTKHQVRQAQVILPFPDRRRMAILSVSSESLADWRIYVEILDGIARSVSFTEPAAASIAERLNL